jgi:hypothetical protein
MSEDELIHIRLNGPASYCILDPIQSTKLKMILGKVMEVFDYPAPMTWCTGFYTVAHIYAPAKTSNEEAIAQVPGSTVCVISKWPPGNVSEKEATAQVGEIFPLVKQVISAIDLTQVNQFVIQRERDTRYAPTRHAYQLNLDISEEGVQACVKTGHMFKKSSIYSTF